MCDTSPTEFSLDSEFTRRRTFHPIPELLQIGLEDECYLIDVGNSSNQLDLSPLATWFQSGPISRVGHAIEQDLEVLQILFGEDVGEIEDTQLAYLFLAHDTPIGYAALVEAKLGLSLSKSQQKSNWRRRPFAISQLQYAANDIKYLLELWHLLREKLHQTGRFEWYREETLRRQRVDPRDPIRLSGNGPKLGNLTALGFEFFQLLDTMRQDRAIKSDIPKNWVLETGTLFRLSNSRYLNKKVLRSLLSNSEFRNLGSQIMKLYSRARELSNNSSSPSLRDVVNQASELHQELLPLAEKMQIAPTLFAPVRELVFAIQAYVKNDKLPKWFGAWREELIGKEVREVANLCREKLSKKTIAQIEESRIA